MGRAGSAAVTCLARGDSGDVPPGVELIRADRLVPAAYEDAVGEWDEVIELAYEPGLVGPALDAVGPALRIGRWCRLCRCTPATAVNAVGEIHTMQAFLSVAVSVTGFDGEFVHVDDGALLAADVHYWAGPRSLPLWLPVEEAGFATRDGGAFLRTGDTLRPLASTLSRGCWPTRWAGASIGRAAPD